MSLKVLNREMVGKKIPACNLFTRYDSIANILKVVINAQDKSCLYWCLPKTKTGLLLLIMKHLNSLMMTCNRYPRIKYIESLFSWSKMAPGDGRRQVLVAHYKYGSCNFLVLTGNDYFRQFGSLKTFHHLKNLVLILPFILFNSCRK